jgi:hypothetical protein
MIERPHLTFIRGRYHVLWWTYPEIIPLIRHVAERGQQQFTQENMWIVNKKPLKNHMTCTYNFTIWYEIAESYDISFKCSQWNWILKAHSFVNEFRNELIYLPCKEWTRIFVIGIVWMIKDFIWLLSADTTTCSDELTLK